MKTLSERRKYLSIGIEIAGIFALLVHLFTIAVNWNSLSGKIPVHFDISGDPDGFGDRSDLLLLFGLSAVLYAGLTVLSLYPEKYNYPWPIAPEDAHRQYERGSLFVQFLKLAGAWLFCLLSMKSMGYF